MLIGEKVLGFVKLTGVAIGFFDNAQVVLTSLVLHLLNIYHILFLHIGLLEYSKMLRIHLNFGI